LDSSSPEKSHIPIATAIKKAIMFLLLTHTSEADSY
jgi:hypothetical protein